MLQGQNLTLLTDDHSRTPLANCESPISSQRPLRRAPPRAGPGRRPQAPHRRPAAHRASPGHHRLKVRMDASQIGKRAWSYAGVLQDAGLSCFEYVEQLTLLLFLKMADQLTEPPREREAIVPPQLGWKTLLPLDGVALENKYREILEKLAAERGMLGVIFKGRALRDPQPGPSEAAHRQSARPGGLAVAAGGREGHHLRGTACPLGAGVLARRRPVLHPASGHPGHVRGDAADFRRPYLRSGRGHGRLSVQRLPARAGPLRQEPRP